VDAGPRSPHYDAGESVVLPFLRWAGVRRLEGIVLTHDDGDHTGGAQAVLRGVEVGSVRAPPPLPGVPGPTRRYAASAAVQGMCLRLDPPLKVLWPPPPGHWPEGNLPPLTSDNAASMVLEVGEGASRMLLLADVDSTVEEALPVASGVALLKVAHHGSGSSSGAGFLFRVRPSEAVISCGRRNPFGHPARGAIERLTAAGIRIHRTDESGALWFEAGEGGVRTLDWRRRAATRGGGRRAPWPPDCLFAPRNP
jgi:competence protein ComEC